MALSRYIHDFIMRAGKRLSLVTVQLAVDLLIDSVGVVWRADARQ